ncbi:MAG: hypothetical protein LBH76_08765 [Propionibacteriaceae bacterium]|jgi:phosphopantothenate-cysteine ligase|nr:hypothetical protein [Propionibacteriaceae bacterium]
MKVLVTAGGTVERIDAVRAIANSSTGRLGRLIAERWAQEPDVDEVFHVAPRRAERPAGLGVTWVEVTDTASVVAALDDLFSRHRIAVAVHAMAVSDYRVRAVTTASRLAGQLRNVVGRPAFPTAAADPLVTAIRTAPGLPADAKLSSHEDDLLLLLEPTPKIIAGFRRWAPETALVGFKLLANASLDDLLAAARQVMTANGCSHVLANDLRDIDGDRHTAYLLDRAGAVTRFETKAEIADGLVAAVRLALPARPTGTDPAPPAGGNP